MLRGYEQYAAGERILDSGLASAGRAASFPVPSRQKAVDPGAVVTLDNNIRKVQAQRQQNQIGGSKQAVPQGKQEGREDNAPMGQFSPAGLDNISFQIIRIVRSDSFLGKDFAKKITKLR